MSKENHKMHPISRDRVEVDGIYANEWGREEVLHRGQTYPSDPQLGATEWELKQFIFDNHHDGRTDPRLVPKAEDKEEPPKQLHPRKHQDRGDK
ncbi:transposase [Paenibacillus apiarius]|uniref:Transposase n=1 Tax=Paenibacillus apiarius TaxID=46240 RepID=A0ABT4DQ12_9BACL|nr:transposase [Paenibacillus apiarius]MBN3524697.1 transposase [Paenibacillus apiarius]MCY9515586.1 transposase [Paenibacillus apiarius]MCY9519341.1 transposase [Paenibacillus apiarius]MCY9550977.1 transposase [Paenibacillus apiarius]MCY9558931.1 transposase [Paenibacillus apiarius]